MKKNIFIFACAMMLVVVTGWLIYSRQSANADKTAASIGIGIGSPSPKTGELALQDVSSLMGSSSFVRAPAENPEDIRTLEGGLKILDVVVGTGEEAKKGMTIAVLYTGTLEDGTIFDRVIDHLKPFQFELGTGRVIKGWDVGIVGMRVGGKRKLAIPPAMAYGAEGAGDVIPPNTPIYFEVELLAVQSAAGSR